MTVNTLGSDSQLGGDSVALSKSRHSRTVAEWLWPFLTQGVALFSISALFYCHFHRTEIVPGSLLQHAVTGLYDVFGLAPSVVFFLMVFAWSSIWLFTGILEKPVVRIGKLLVMALMLGVFFNLGSGGVAADTHTGSLGAWIASRLVVGIGYVPSIILVWPTMFASVMLATDWFFTEWFERDRRTTNFEVGVEDAVTDHLRGLSSIANKPQLDEPEPVRPAALGAATPAAATIEVAERAAVTDAPVEEIGEPVAVDPVAEEPVAEEPVAEVPSVAPLAVRGAWYTEEDDGSESDVTGEAAVVKPTRALSYAERRRLRAERRSTEEVGGPAPVASPTEPVEAAAIPEKGSGRPLVGKAELEALFGADDDAAVVDSEATGAEIPGAEDPGAEANGLMSVEHEVAEEHEDEVEYEDEDELEGEETEGEEESEEGEEEEYEEEEEGDELEEEHEEEEESGEAEYESEEEDGEVDAEFEEEGLEDEELEEEADEEVEDVAHAEAEVVVDNGVADDGVADDNVADNNVAWHDVSAESVAEPSEIAASEVEVREAEAAAAALEDASEATEIAASSEAGGSIVSIPRSDQVAPVSLPTPPAVVGERETAASKQQKLFASRVDEDLLLEAMDLVSHGRRTTATLLQRKLRIDYELAVEVLEELMNRGLLAGDEDRS